MPQNPREEMTTTRSAPQAEAVDYPDDPPLAPVIRLKLPGSPEPHPWAIASEEDKALLADALVRCGGLKAVIRELVSMSLRHRLSPDELQRDAYLHVCDIKRIGKALRQGRSADYLALLLAEAVVFGWLRNKSTDAGFQKMKVNSAIAHLKRKNAKYRKGPQTRMQKTEHRRELVRQLWNGDVDDTTIVEVLCRDYGIKVALKTVRNDISIIRKG
jgi:hypothetical protein